MMPDIIFMVVFALSDALEFSRRLICTEKRTSLVVWLAMVRK